jgi:hypothetical protein
MKKNVVFRLSLVLNFLWVFSMVCVAQSKKDIRKHKIKITTETITTFENGKETLRNNQFRRFDKEGQVIEEIDYDKNGKLKTKTLSKYNNLEQKTEETTFDANNKQLVREVYKYDADGEKSEEWHYNEKNELENKSIYTLKNGLKTERKTYDSKGKLIEVKKYGYQ